MQEARAARACETKGDLEDMIAAGEAERPPPHYMQSTGARDAMMETKKYVVASTVKSIRQLREQKAAAAAAAGLPWPPPKKKGKDKKAEKMTMEQLELEEKVMRRVQAPLAFARNPRFVLPPRKPVSEAAPQPPRVANPDMWILCKPERVNFTQYEVGGVYEIPLELHNVSALSRRRPARRFPHPRARPFERRDSLAHHRRRVSRARQRRSRERRPRASSRRRFIVSPRITHRRENLRRGGRRRRRLDARARDARRIDRVDVHDFCARREVRARACEETIDRDACRWIVVAFFSPPPVPSRALE